MSSHRINKKKRILVGTPRQLGPSRPSWIIRENTGGPPSGLCLTPFCRLFVPLDSGAVSPYCGPTSPLGASFFSSSPSLPVSILEVFPSDLRDSSLYHVHLQKTPVALSFPICTALFEARDWLAVDVRESVPDTPNPIWTTIWRCCNVLSSQQPGTQCAFNPQLFGNAEILEAATKGKGIQRLFGDRND